MFTHQTLLLILCTHKKKKQTNPHVTFMLEKHKANSKIEIFIQF